MASQPNLVTYDQALGVGGRVIATALTAAQQLERGQAETPLADHFRLLENELSDESWTLCAVVAPQAFGPLVAWLCGGVQSNVRAMATPNELIELTFHGERFVLETSAGAELFDSLDELVQALGPEAPPSADPPLVRLSAPAAGRATGLRVLILVDAERLGRDPGLLSLMLTRSNALWLVGTPEWRLDDQTREALKSLRSGMDFLCSILIANATTPLASSGWWQEIPAIPSRQRPLCLGPDSLPTLPPLVGEDRNSLRRALRLNRLQKRARQGLDTLKERLEFLRQQQRARRQREERTERTLGEGAADSVIRASLDAARAGLGEEITSLQRGLQEVSRRSLAREGTLARAVDGLVESVTAADIVQSPGGRVTTLSLDEGFTERFARNLRQVFKDELRRDLVTLRDGLRVAADAVQDRLKKVLGISMQLELPPPDERPIREVLSDVLQLQLRYRGEIPKRGFIQRLAAGRRMLFAALMTISLFGGLLTGGKNVRSLLAPFGLLFVAAFVGAVLWTYRSWEEEDRERISKEITKIREQLHTEAMRLVRDGERERLTRLSEALEVVRKDALRRIDDFGRQITQQAAANQAQERHAVRDRLRVIDQRAKELDTQRTTLQRAEQDATELARLADSLVRQAVTEAPAAAT